MTDGTDCPKLLSQRYETILHLASGGMGSVHLARSRGELGFSRLVAIKLLHQNLAKEADIVARFLEEARVASRVKHPHVVTVLDVGLDAEGTPFLVLEHVHGASLFDLLASAEREGRPTDLGIISAIFIDALEGLHAAHEAVDEHGASLGLVHRDVTPYDILLDASGAAYVTDFGVAKVKDRLRSTRSGIVGKPSYLSPEQLAADSITRAADVFSTALCLREAIGTRRPGVPAELDALVLSMLERDPRRRPPTALAAAEALARIVPRAPRAKVADWVTGHAQAELDRIQLAIRKGRSEPARAPAAAPAPRPSSTIAIRAGVAVLAGILALVLALVLPDRRAAPKPQLGSSADKKQTAHGP